MCMYREVWHFCLEGKGEGGGVIDMGWLLLSERTFVCVGFLRILVWIVW